MGAASARRIVRKASEAIGNTVTMFMGIALVLMVVLIAAVRPIVGDYVYSVGGGKGRLRYLTICFIGIPFITAYNIISCHFSGDGGF